MILVPQQKSNQRIEFLDQLGIEYAKIGIFDTNLLQDHYNF